jgi:hypothetical protein
MPEFRKWIPALAATALFAGLANAQVGTGPGTSAGTQFTCTTTNGAVTPTLRAEGYTELTGDIIIACTGGAPPALGSTIPTANITIFQNTAVTSRLLPATNNPNASEALLLIDEPGSGLTGVGPSVPQTFCGSLNAGVGAGVGGCSQVVGTVGANAGVAVSSSAPGTAGANVFQGVVSGNSVTFFGIPILAPSSTGLSRVFRITNIRANANGVTAGGPTPGSVVASISISGSTSLPITNSTLTTGFVQQGLSATGTLLRNGANNGNGSGSGTTFNQCTGVSITSTSSTAAPVGVLQFQENFATAFKVRYTAGVAQNIPGTIYNSESGFYLNGASFNSGFGTTTSAGLADYGTRLKATFNNVPSGVSLYVSTRDISNGFSVNSNTLAQAVLVVSEGAIDAGVPPAANTVPAATATANYAGPVFTAGGSAPGISPVPVSGTGAGSAVWEIISTNPASIDTVAFGVYINYSASPATNSPSAPGTITVTMSFAPTPSGGLFTSSTGAAASSGLGIPRFSDSLDITKNLANFALCTTSLLYPYVINTNGFDTGLAIANTTTDPFGTTPQVGTCTLNFYGSTPPTTSFVTASIPTGTVYANLASTVSPGFSGYIIAVCNFQLAHGFAFVSDVGARNLAMGYLALVLTRSGTSPENLNN